MKFTYTHNALLVLLCLSGTIWSMKFDKGSEDALGKFVTDATNEWAKVVKADKAALQALTTMGTELRKLLPEKASPELTANTYDFLHTKPEFTQLRENILKFVETNATEIDNLLAGKDRPIITALLRGTDKHLAADPKQFALLEKDINEKAPEEQTDEWKSLLSKLTSLPPSGYVTEKELQLAATKIFPKIIDPKENPLQQINEFMANNTESAIELLTPAIIAYISQVASPGEAKDQHQHILAIVSFKQATTPKKLASAKQILAAMETMVLGWAESDKLATSVWSNFEKTQPQILKPDPWLEKIKAIMQKKATKELKELEAKLGTLIGNLSNSFAQLAGRLKK